MKISLSVWVFVSFDTYYLPIYLYLLFTVNGSSSYVIKFLHIYDTLYMNT